MLLIVEKVLLLGEVEFLAGLPGETLAEMALELEEQEFVANLPIISSGDLVDNLYIIASGKIAVYKNNELAHELGERDYFGALAALDPFECEVEYRALEDGVLLVLNHDRLYDALADYPDLVQAVIKYLCARCTLKEFS